MNNRLLKLTFNSRILLKSKENLIKNRFSSTAAYTGRYDFETLIVTSPAEHVLSVELNRPDSFNCINKEMFREIYECFKRISDDQYARAIVLSGHGNRFSSGMDWNDMTRYMESISGKKLNESSTTEILKEDVARKAKLIRSMLIQLQKSFTVLEKCSKPIISSVSSSCVGAGLALLCTTDIRYCSKDAYFKVKEVDTGMASDLGSLQRLPKITGNDSVIRELVYTARRMEPEEAKEIGLIGKIFDDPETCKQAALETAKLIAKKSPVAVQGSKVLLKYSRDHSTWDGLRVSANWNMAMLQSEDLFLAAKSLINNEPANFNDL